MKAQPRGSDEGFTLIEVVVALVVIALVLAGVAGVMVTSLRTASFARERQNAASLTQAALETIRALPFAAIATGSTSSQLAADSTDNTFTPVVFSPSAGQYRLLSASGEMILNGASSSVPPSPLSPPGDITENGITYRIRSYISQSSSDPTGVYHATVITRWRSVARTGQQQQYAVQSIITSDVGCSTSETHPFPGPCSNFFYSGADAGRSIITVENELAGTTVQLMGASASAKLQREQVSTASASGGSAWISSGSTSGFAPSYPYTPLSIKTSSNSASGLPANTQSSVEPGAPAASTSTSGLVATISAATGTVTGRAASNAGTCSIAGSPSATPASTDPCAYSASDQSGQASISADDGPLTGSAIVSQTGGSVATASVLESSAGGSFCSLNGGAGCTSAKVSRVVGGISLVQLGSAAVVSVGGYSEALTVEGGPGSASPSLSRSITTLSWPGFSAVSLDGSSAAQSALDAIVASPPYSASIPGGLGTVQVSAVSLKAGSTAQVAPGSCSSACKPELATEPLLTAAIRVTVFDSANTLQDSYLVKVNFGAPSAFAAFRAAT